MHPHILLWTYIFYLKYIIYNLPSAFQYPPFRLDSLFVRTQDIWTRQQVAKTNINGISVGESLITTENVRTLESWFDSNFTMSSHVTKTACTCFHLIHNIRQLRKVHVHHLGRHFNSLGRPAPLRCVRQNIQLMNTHVIDHETIHLNIIDENQSFWAIVIV